MKNIILAAIFTSTISFAQVGINTTNPTKDLDINGDLKISTLTNKTGQSTHRMIIAADKSADPNHGNVGKITFPSLEQSETKNVEISKTIYINPTPITANTCSCGEVTFFINSTDNKPYIRLKSADIFPSLGADTSSFTVGYGVKSWSGAAGTAGTYNYKNITNKTFTKSAFSTNLELDNTAFATNDTANLRVYTLVLPKQNNLYRFTISRLKNTNTAYQYALICEKFYIKAI